MGLFKRKKKKESTCGLCKMRYEDIQFFWPIEDEDICLDCYRAGVIWASEKARE